MGIEIEKKYRLTRDESSSLQARLRERGAVWRSEDFEENVIYGGGSLDSQNEVLRLRRTERGATLTYKRQDKSASSIKRHLEEETRIEDADAMHSILDVLGFRPALVYEKRRETWNLDDVEVAIDELPFGWFVEIEGDERAIFEVEGKLNLAEAETVHQTYPDLTIRNGVRKGTVIESRF
jgi:adenylate cyclase, class 2